MRTVPTPKQVRLPQQSVRRGPTGAGRRPVVYRKKSGWKSIPGFIRFIIWAVCILVALYLLVYLIFFAALGAVVVTA